jgi:uncharacterized membrane protein YkvA (DUF1232 family)
MIRVLLIGVGCLAASWVVMIVLAARLPPGILKERPRRIPSRLRHDDPNTPERSASASPREVGAGVWVISPIDLIPEFLPVIGPLDDIVVALAFRYAARQIPADVLYDAWPADPNLLRRLLGSRKPLREVD